MNLSRRDLSKGISDIENRLPKALRDLSKRFGPHSLEKTVCFTGPAGVGKSTLIAQLALEASVNHRVAWLACDPSSPETGGSLLGDRIRLAQDSANEKLFVRSFSTRSSSAFSKAIRDIEIYLESYFDYVWVETAGSGQTQSEVARLSALTVLILQPETGDEIQWMKSGVRDWADLFVVNKSDLPGADLMAQSLIEHGAREDRVFLTSSHRARGVSELLSKLLDFSRNLNWKSRSKVLHREHARSLFLESELDRANQKFNRRAESLSKNPYRSLFC